MHDLNATTSVMLQFETKYLCVCRVYLLAHHYYDDDPKKMEVANVSY